MRGDDNQREREECSAPSLRKSGGGPPVHPTSTPTARSAGPASRTCARGRDKPPKPKKGHGFGLQARPIHSRTPPQFKRALKGNPKPRTNLGCKHSPETRHKISQSNMRCGPRSEETWRKIRLAKTGRKLTCETRQKMSAAKKGKRISEAQRWPRIGRKLWPNGRKFSEEHRRKLSIAGAGRRLSREHRRNLSLALIGNRRGVNIHAKTNYHFCDSFFALRKDSPSGGSYRSGNSNRTDSFRYIAKH
jgi:hypothetical protein